MSPKSMPQSPKTLKGKLKGAKRELFYKLFTQLNNGDKYVKTKEEYL